MNLYPHPNHVPLHVAWELGFFREEGVEVELLVPSDPSAPAKLVAALIAGALGGLLSRREHGIQNLNYEVLAVELLGYTPVFFPQEDYGVPNTYELLFIAHPELLRERPEEVRAVLRAGGWPSPANTPRRPCTFSCACSPSSRMS